MLQNPDHIMVDMCQDRLGHPVNDCDTVDPPAEVIVSGSDDDSPFVPVEFWKQGGQFFRDCITWEIISNNIAG